MKKITYPTSHIDLRDIILTGEAQEREHIVIDCQYFAQPYRKTAIVSGRFKYEYDKHTKKEALYDVCDDFYEYKNLLIKQKYDVDRHAIVYVSEVSFFPYESEAKAILPKMRAIRENMWQCGGFWEEEKAVIKKTLLRPKLALLRIKKERRIVKNTDEYER